MPVTIDGSPTHVLIVHLVVVLLPISVLAALVLVAVPATRRAFALLTLVVAFIACVAIPFAFLSGSKLEASLPPSTRSTATSSSLTSCCLWPPCSAWSSPSSWASTSSGERTPVVSTTSSGASSLLAVPGPLL